MINYIALLTALTLSGVSGFYSVYGLTTLFAGAFYPVLFMGGTLELAKLVTASWLYNNWNICPKYLRYYLSSIVIVLMLISSMGTFGFLSKAHIDQQISMTTGDSEQLELIREKFEFQNETVQDINNQIVQIDNSIEDMKGEKALRASENQRKNRTSLLKRKEEEVKKLTELSIQKTQLEGKVKKLEAEVGPVKYIAQLIYGEKASSGQLEKAIRYVIILIVLVFDPLAVSLLIAANIGLNNKTNLKNITKDSILIMNNDTLRKE